MEYVLGDAYAGYNEAAGIPKQPLTHTEVKATMDMLEELLPNLARVPAIAYKRTKLLLLNRQ
jgi:hypothetical protein